MLWLKKLQNAYSSSMQNTRDFTERIKENTSVLCSNVLVVSQHITSQTGEFSAGLNDTVSNFKTVSVACSYITKFVQDVCLLN
jgi:hypothetical protein